MLKSGPPPWQQQRGIRKVTETPEMCPGFRPLPPGASGYSQDRGSRQARGRPRDCAQILRSEAGAATFCLGPGAPGAPGAPLSGRCPRPAGTAGRGAGPAGAQHVWRSPRQALPATPAHGAGVPGRLPGTCCRREKPVIQPLGTDRLARVPGRRTRETEPPPWMRAGRAGGVAWAPALLRASLWAEPQRAEQDCGCKWPGAELASACAPGPASPGGHLSAAHPLRLHPLFPGCRAPGRFSVLSCGAAEGREALSKKRGRLRRVIGLLHPVSAHHTDSPCSDRRPRGMTEANKANK